MIVIDTNVVSEPVRRRPDPHVLDWLLAESANLAITTVTIGELVYGARRLPTGRRQTEMIKAVEQMIKSTARHRLPYDEDAARAFAGLRAEHEARGRQFSAEDGMIAGICAANGAAIATRNVRHFEGLGLEVINPWEPRDRQP
ncbi:type II toxin-antitoxin system VapC family toxin [Microlunatus parietis]|uniref:Ribonuclease VapC n=1 Tax=Microlunatus parietis TaxID=682979 RepID=A0A7Y9I7V4_9ACTN|nr:type II toxin-antitoxin system VapC family toxin [Microlunatus parietis]NYE71812.1 hypothetical protein [Microlunatus parietis]